MIPNAKMEDTPIFKVGYLVDGINSGMIAYSVDEERFNVQTVKALKEILRLLDNMRGDINIRIVDLREVT